MDGCFCPSCTETGACYVFVEADAHIGQRDKAEDSSKGIGETGMRTARGDVGIAPYESAKID